MLRRRLRIVVASAKSDVSSVSDKAAPAVFPLESLDFLPQLFVLPDFPRQETASQIRLGRDTRWCQQVEIRHLVLALAVVFGLHEALRNQRPQAEVHLAQADADRRRDLPLRQ